MPAWARVAILLIAAAVVAVALGRGTGLNRSDQALAYAEAKVKWLLNNPSAADFPLHEQVAVPEGEHSYRVKGIVYSTNGYGGTMPAPYSALVEFSEDGRTHTVSQVVINDRPMGD